MQSCLKFLGRLTGKLSNLSLPSNLIWVLAHFQFSFGQILVIFVENVFELPLLIVFLIGLLFVYGEQIS